MPSAMRTIEQERAKYAWECVNEVKDEPFAGDYRNIAVKASSLILTNGLGQTLAFLKAKGKGDPADEHEVLFSQISNWLKKQLGIGRDDALEWIVNDADSHRYRLATMEVLALLQWLKRFAEATLPKGGEE